MTKMRMKNDHVPGYDTTKLHAQVDNDFTIDVIFKKRHYYHFITFAVVHLNVVYMYVCSLV